MNERKRVRQTITYYQFPQTEIGKDWSKYAVEKQEENPKKKQEKDGN